MISTSDLDLILSFIVRESKDYTPPKEDDWITRILCTLKAKIPEDYGKLTLISIGNSGITLRELIFYGNGKTPCSLLIDTDGEGTVYTT